MMSALLVDHEHRRPPGDRFHFVDQVAELLRISDVAAKQHDGVGLDLPDDLFFEIGQRLAC